jgi:exodeoxyribonuclease-3
MKLATWNVNSLSVRLPQVLDWLSHNPVDVLALQELKMTDDKFPGAAFEAAGYCASGSARKPTTEWPCYHARQPRMW